MIELDEFEISRKEWLKLIFWHGYKTYCWTFVYVVVILTAVSIVTGDWFSLAFFVTVFVITVSIIHYFRYWRYSPSEQDSHLYQKQYVSFDTDKYHIRLEDGSESHILLSHIPRVDRLGNYYRLFMTITAFSPIPISAFRCEEDRKQFEVLFHDKMPSKADLQERIVVFLLFSALLLGSASYMAILEYGLDF